VSDGKFKRKNKTKMDFAPEVLDKLARALADAGYHFMNQNAIDEAVRKIAGQVAASKGKGYFSDSGFSISRALRGVNAMAGHQVNTNSAESDIAYAKKTLLTGTTPGQFLVPTIQADQIIQLLTSDNVIRQAGARIWPMAGVQKMNLPTATAAPNIVWGDGTGSGAGGQGVTLVPSDPNIGQLAFDLKSQKSLTAIPNELLAVSLPAVDQIISELLSLSFAQDEMNSMVATAQGTAKPMTIYAAAGTNSLLANSGSANGGAVNLSDLLGVLGAFFAAKGKGNPCWFMHSTVFYKDVMGIKDSSNRPIVTGFQSLENKFQGLLFGYPVYVSAEFPTNQAVGSGSNQSYIVFTNPQYLNIADAGSLELAVSFERFFDSNQTAVRGVHRVDFGYAPASAIILLKGVNV
jgi:HK97 family phage major capsid protein